MVLAMRVTIAACSAAAAAWCVACSRRRGRTLHPQPASKQGTDICDDEIGNQCPSVPDRGDEIGNQCSSVPDGGDEIGNQWHPKAASHVALADCERGTGCL